MDKLQGKETPPFLSNIPIIPTPQPSPQANNLNTTNSIVPTCTPTPSSAVFTLGVGPNTGNPVPSPTPSSTNQVPQSSDDILLNNLQITGGGTLLRIGYGTTTDNLTGLFRIATNLSQSYPARIYIVGSGLVGDLTISNFTLSAGTTVSEGNFTSALNGARLALRDITRNKPDYSVIFMVSVTTPTRTYNFPFVRSIIPYDCPDYGYKPFDIIDLNDMQIILQNPCCECFPNGTNGSRIILEGTTCDLTGANC
jgi:hypothetical protein